MPTISAAGITFAESFEMKGMLVVMGLTGTGSVSGFVFSLGTDKAASGSLYREVMMPSEWTPAVGIPASFG
jgi:hypothetical protein